MGHVLKFIAYVGIPAMMCRWRSGDNLVELVSFFHLFVGSGDTTQVARPAKQALFPDEPSHLP